MKVTGWPGMDLADVRLVDRHPDLHPREVLGDQEEAGGIQARNDGLTDVDAAVDDDALDRRLDRAVAQIPLRPLHIRLGLGEAALGLHDRRLADGHVRLGRVVGRLVVVVACLRQRL